MPNSQRQLLLLSTYPLVEPKHGGQVRILNIKKAFERAGWAVTPIAVYEEEAYSIEEVGVTDVPFPQNHPRRLFNGSSVPLITDLTSGMFAYAADGALPEILANLPAKIDAIHVEQPWLWPLAAKIKATPAYSNAVTIFGSANIEAPLKQSIFKSCGIAEPPDVIAAIDALEKRAAREADISVAVTQAEVDVLAEWGARSPFLLPNGIEPWQADEASIAEWRQKLPRFPWMLYVASAHPPNFSNFIEIFGGAMGCFPPNGKLVVAGSVAEHIYRVAEQSRFRDLNLSRLHLLFKLPDRDLSAVKTLAHGFVLPIPFGGGSNIKTAEALYSGAHVVGTPAAFRGFEKFIDLPEVKVAGDTRSLHAAIREVITAPPVNPDSMSAEARALRDSLRWDVCLAPLPAAAERGVRARNRAA